MRGSIIFIGLEDEVQDVQHGVHADLAYVLASSILGTAKVTEFDLSTDTVRYIVYARKQEGKERINTRAQSAIMMTVDTITAITGDVVVFIGPRVIRL